MRILVIKDNQMNNENKSNGKGKIKMDLLRWKMRL